MKLSLISIILLCWTNSYAMADSDPCMNQVYQKETDENIWEKFKNEFSILGNAKKHVKKLFGSTETSYSIKDEMEKYLCACAIYKRNPSKRSFQEVYENMESDKATIGVRIPYFVFKYNHKFRAIYCESSTESCIIAKGPEQKSLERPVYNIYVADIVEDKFIDFKGTIDNVDVEKMSDIPIPIHEQVPES